MAHEPVKDRTDPRADADPARPQPPCAERQWRAHCGGAWRVRALGARPRGEEGPPWLAPWPQRPARGLRQAPRWASPGGARAGRPLAVAPAWAEPKPRAPAARHAGAKADSVP